MRIWVDADACPRGALAIIKEQAMLHGIEITTVSNYNHDLQGSNHLTVDASAQAADMAIVSRMIKGDLVITQDYGLAALALARQGMAISPMGQEFTPQNIDHLLTMRAINAKVRRSSKHAKIRGPSARTREDDLNFQHTLIEVLLRMKSAD
ncbi:YaiI/YqxD family protein [Sulfoacidibacillus thermotolerans]|uniref:UPF0178 protein BM613_11130 n=1 Tax=Sulfoacidibacillus thermotolerans TaxID=1765684 RepID=A0A2U3D6N9_SULT2|nr:DUF188 domain-containing protein [Sulfoacidibacillus thermotolerans]PWI56950.1 hypothetical protein BM613_11130 [Sulfoacidibacillus thermotolerans]